MTAIKNRKGRKRKSGRRTASGDLARSSTKKSPYALDVATIYVLSADEYAVKIGVARDVGRRVAAIQSSQEKVIRIYWGVIIHRAFAFEVEQAVHRRLRGTQSHLRGEWYLMNPAQAVAEIKKEIKRLGYNSMPDSEWGYEAAA